ncbi:MAG: hypothetical protein WCK98_02340 [bacterium]
MAFSDSLSRQIETASLYFHGGVRRSVIIFAGICIVLMAPAFFLGQSLSAIWSTLPANPDHIQNKNIYIQKNLSENDYSIDRSQLVPLSTSGTVLYTTINNRQNQDYGYYPFVYRVQVLDIQNSIIYEKIEQSYLLPGDIKYVVVAPGDDRGVTLRVSTEPDTRTLLYNPQAINLSKRINVEVRNPTVTDGDGEASLVLRASIKNKDIVRLKIVDLMYLIRDNRDRVVGVGQYKLENLQPGEEREFYLTYPKPRYRRATRLDIRTFVNYLDDNNIVLN